MWMRSSFPSAFFSAARRHVFAAWLLALGLGFGLNAAAQTVQFEVKGVGSSQIPIAIPAFANEEAVDEKVSQIIMADLQRSGQFRAVDSSGLLLRETSVPDMNAWRAKITDALAAGSINTVADGYELRFTLWDVVKGQALTQQSISVPSNQLRYGAHRIADIIYKQLTGQQGVFATRVAYITKSGGNYNLWIADAADGEYATPALTSKEPIISPAFSPRGDELAYVSFESRKPVVYIHHIASGKRRVLANFKGSNSAPAWAPDGQSLLVSLSRDGGTQIFRISRDGGTPQKLTQSAINTEATFSPDGSKIYFVSDRGGSPQIYRMPAGGGSAERVTFGAAQSISPALSPDGRWLAYIAREGGGYKLRVMDLSTGSSQAITQTVEDERPSFAPNSRLIVYATRQGGSELLMNTTLDGNVKTRLVAKRGDIREPSWGK